LAPPQLRLTWRTYALDVFPAPGRVRRRSGGAARLTSPGFRSGLSKLAQVFAKNYLLTHTAAGNDINGNPVTVQSSGLKAVYAGAASAAFFGVQPRDPRDPDILGIAQHGIVYTGHKSKIAEHGGNDQQDRNVPILVALPGLTHGHIVDAPVETTQIAPTILALLGLPSRDLQAVRIEHTRVLPGTAVRP